MSCISCASVNFICIFANCSSCSCTRLQFICFVYTSVKGLHRKILLFGLEVFMRVLHKGKLVSQYWGKCVEKIFQWCWRVPDMRKETEASILYFWTKITPCSKLEDPSRTGNLLHVSELLYRDAEIILNKEVYYWRWPFSLQNDLYLSEKLPNDFLSTRTLICQEGPLISPSSQMLNCLAKISKPYSHNQIFFHVKKHGLSLKRHSSRK